jgi:tRNA(Ile)-lysidine synthase
LIETDKATLLAYLDRHHRRYFIDESNYHDRYVRNRMRAQFSEAFLETFQQGVVKSFEYLQKDKERLFRLEIAYHDKELYILKRGISDIRSIDYVVKKMGYLLSRAQKEEISRLKSLVIADQIVIEFSKDYIYIAPFNTISMDKKFKELCRILGIPAKIRPYLLAAGIAPNDLLLSQKVS